MRDQSGNHQQNHHFNEHNEKIFKNIDKRIEAKHYGFVFVQSKAKWSCEEQLCCEKESEENPFPHLLFHHRGLG
jgi:hypothetical protein